METRTALDALREERKADAAAAVPGMMDRPSELSRENIERANQNMTALTEAQKTFEGVAEKAGFSSEEELIDFLKELRQSKV